MRRFWNLAWLMVLAWGPGAAMAARPAPQIGMPALAQPLPLPYSDGADAMAAVESALAQAKLNGKRVLIDLGGNWCPDCRVLAGVMALPAVQTFLTDNFILVTVDVGRLDKNLDVPRRFGVERLVGVPTVLVVSADGQRVNSGSGADLADARAMTPQAIVDWLARWAGD